MPAHAAVWWATLVVLAVVLVLCALQLAGAFGQVKRLKNRLASYEDLPVVRALAATERTEQRLTNALTQLEPLAERARIALAVIRRGPLPPEFSAAWGRFRAELAAFRAVRR